MNPVELERRLQRIERQLDELASAGRPRVQSGTWTPDLYGATTYGVTTYTTRTGEYVVINRVCVVWLTVVWTSTTASGQLRITIPFACDSSYPILPLRASFFAYAANAMLVGDIVPGSSYIRLIEFTNAGGVAALDVPATGFLSFSGMYLIAP